MPSSASLEYHQTTVEAFISQLQPRAWNRPIKIPPGVSTTFDDWPLFNTRWDLERFFDWPPDVFAMTSLLLHRSGAYRAGITPPEGELWPPEDWRDTCRTRALEWREWLCESTRLGRRVPHHPLRAYIDCIDSCAKLPINDLYNVETVMEDRTQLGLPARVWQLCMCLLELHAIADETMRGVGTLFAPHVSLFCHENKPAPTGIERLHLQANLLLALRGTISRIGRHRGIVLPKSRTPQSGVTLRSLSLHLSFHHTEVDVAWRAVPWTNMDENTLNLLLVPWPYNIGARAFKPESGPPASQLVGNGGFFAYEPHTTDGGIPFDPVDVVNRIEAAEREAKRVHFLVFPEAALCQSDLNRLKNELERRVHPSRMPLVVAGLTGRDAKHVAFNRVVLSLYHAQRWYDMEQDKHHRWKLDPDQIAGYSLGGTLSGARSWWESIRIPRRRLSFLTSNSWLTLAPLICEDLARLEPISDLIRGVGPTLLIALLLDGPQLTTRWPARYAGVLADDPGTSVLTLTSLGMVQRSIPPRVSREEAAKTREENGANVALWNDQFWRWHPIKVAPGQGAAMLTVATQWIKEDTFDMRAEAENSAVFTFQSVHIPKLDDDLSRRATRAPVLHVASAETPASEAGPTTAEPSAPPAAPESSQAEAALTEPATPAVAPEISLGGDGGSGPAARRVEIDSARADMSELSLFTFYVDALIDTPPGEEQKLRNWFYSVVGVRNDGKVLPRKPDHESGPVDGELLTLLRWSLWHRKGNPATIPTPHLLLAISAVTDIVARVPRARDDRDKDAKVDARWGDYWTSLVDAAEQALDRSLARMAEDIASGGAVDGLNAPTGGLYSRYLHRLEKRYGRLAALAHRNAGAEASERQRPESIPPLRRREAGRIMFSAPLSILWAVHNRLSIRRRTHTLLIKETHLLRKIEKVLESNFHLEFQKWRAWVAPTRATDVPPAP